MFYVKSLLIALSVLGLLGCTTPPQVKTYPEPPKELMVQPKPLELLPADASLEDVSVTVTKNYALYHLTAQQLKSLQEWVTRLREEADNVDGRNQGNKKEVR